MIEFDGETIAGIIAAHLPGRHVTAVYDRGEWVRRNYRIVLDDGSAIALKVHVHEEWFDTTLHEERVVALMAEHGLRMPRVLAADATCALAPAPYVLQEWAGGERMGDLLARTPEGATGIYRAVGAFYRRLHDIPGPRSGVWFEDPAVTLPVSPNDYMFGAEIADGSGRRAVGEGHITQRTHDRAVRLWQENLDYLKEHRPALVHYSAFPWTIYLDGAAASWRITKLTALGDFLWWDPAVDLAMLRYPPYGETTPAEWEAFLEAYGPAPEARRLHLYSVLGRLCAAMGAYMAPEAPTNRAWAARCLEDLDGLLDMVEKG